MACGRCAVVANGTAVDTEMRSRSSAIATAGCCLSAAYMAAWFIARLEGVGAARDILRHAAPVGENDSYATRAMACVAPYL